MAQPRNATTDALAKALESESLVAQPRANDVPNVSIFFPYWLYGVPRQLVPFPAWLYGVRYMR